MIKILQVLPSLNVCGGVENYLMNYYQHIDRVNYSFDFAVHAVDDDYFKSLIEKNGDKIYVLPPFTLKNFKQIKKEIKNIFTSNKYDIVHCHQANGAYFYFKTAKKCGVKCRILHSHQSKAADKFLHAVRNTPLLFLGKKYSTDYFACSALAGDYLFKKNYSIVANAINTQKFGFSKEVRESIRKEYSIPHSSFVIGHIGRMCPQKNQSFLIDIFEEVLKSKKDSRLLLVGGGEDGTSLEEKVNLLNISDKVIFTGTSTRTNEFYSAMDVFVLPSLYEGLPVVGVEAQCNGLTVITTDNVTLELKLLDSTAFLSLKKPAGYWAEYIL